MIRMSEPLWVLRCPGFESHQLLYGRCQLNGRSPYGQDFLYGYTLVAVLQASLAQSPKTLRISCGPRKKWATCAPLAT